MMDIDEIIDKTTDVPWKIAVTWATIILGALIALTVAGRIFWWGTRVFIQFVTDIAT